ncbi:MAG: ABC transporter permease subunit [Clostridiales bacterium]|nr:ABC transporter permease subunit [Clostridiales bacterium]
MGNVNIHVNSQKASLFDIYNMTAASFKRTVKRNWQLYVLLLPSLVYIIMFCYAPMYGVLLAFKNFNPRAGIWGSEWAGLKYFRQFFGTSIFATTLKNTVVLSVMSLLCSFPAPIIFALLLHQVRNSKVRRFIQTITYAPNFISVVVLVSMIILFLAPSSGFLSNLLSAFTGKDSLYLVRPEYFRPIYIISGIWQSMGFSAIVYLAALTAVNPELHEAASMDGAGILLRIWHIDIPGILPTIIIMLILAVGNILSVGYEKVFLLQNGMNLSVSEVISTYVFKTGVKNAQYGFATAVGLFNSVVNLVLLVASNYVAKTVTQTSLF